MLKVVYGTTSLMIACIGTDSQLQHYSLSFKSWSRVPICKFFQCNNTALHSACYYQMTVGVKSFFLK